MATQIFEELADYPSLEAEESAQLADVYREWELDSNDPRFVCIQKQLHVDQIRRIQAFVLILLSKGLSVLLLARTGWGKSLIFQGFRFAVMKDPDRSQPSRKITIVFVPLSALGQDQASEINEEARAFETNDKARHDVAIFYDKTKVADKHLLEICNGTYDWVFISPEKALHPQTVKSLWENVDFRAKILLFAVDEGHLVAEWGGGGFRKAYDQLGIIRNYFGDTVPWFVTSATMPTGTRKEVMQSLGIGSYKSIITELDRPNLYYNIMISRFGARFKGEGGTALDFIFDEVRRSGTTTPDQIEKTIVYFDDIGQLKLFVKHFRKLLPPHLRTSHVSLIQPYYADRSDVDKKAIRDALTKGTCRIICATEAFGLGLNVKDIPRVYQVNLPRNMAQLIQRFGRGGRLNAICTIVLSKSWKKLSADPSYQPGNKAQRKIQGGPKKELYRWLVDSCLRKGFLKFLDVPSQYNPMVEVGQCCSRCTDRAVTAKIEIERPVIGYQGLADLELEASRIAEEKSKRAELALQKTHPICQTRVFQDLVTWRDHVYTNAPTTDGMMFPEMIAPNLVLELISKNSRGILFHHCPVHWAGIVYCETHHPRPGWRQVVADAWRDTKEEVEEAIETERVRRKEAAHEKKRQRALATPPKWRRSQLSRVQNVDPSDGEKSGSGSEADGSGTDSSTTHRSDSPVEREAVGVKRGPDRPKGSKNKPKKDPVGGKSLLKTLASKSQGQFRTGY